MKKLLILSFLLLSGCHSITLSTPLELDKTPTTSLTDIENKLTSIKNDNTDKTDKAKTTLIETEKKGQEIVSDNPSITPLKDLEKLWETSSNLVQGYIVDIKQDGVLIQDEITKVETYKKSIDELNVKITTQNDNIALLKKDDLVKDKTISDDKIVVDNLKVDLNKEREVGWKHIYIFTFIILGFVGTILGYLFRNKIMWIIQKIEAKI